ncbi:hypothetical protein MPTK1_4g21820 [Marchantia polymorpha subsp. ruderalis]|uniref:Uncharacterized protein n=1 Tax=Marchantia polymorpha subsp. ruderalis TaxID=1480154 RepID=A0AAF6BCF0_MARPO|nr:hypothetical protein Mp_4g21820 [Marchantia polymorpha subsp. ruderalis]
MLLPPTAALRTTEAWERERERASERGRAREGAREVAKTGMHRPPQAPAQRAGGGSGQAGVGVGVRAGAGAKEGSGAHIQTKRYGGELRAAGGNTPAAQTSAGGYGIGGRG